MDRQTEQMGLTTFELAYRELIADARRGDKQALRDARRLARRLEALAELAGDIEREQAAARRARLNGRV